MMRAFIPPIAASIVAAGATVGLAPPAAADEGPLLALQQQFAFLTADQLLTEGYWACRAAASGMGSSAIVPLVQQHLKYSGASIAVVNTIVSTAIVHLDC
jgi:hypothetical protein